MKDNFSSNPEQYARYRPTYPDALFEYVLSLCTRKEHAWDCGTGNGQVAQVLAAYFNGVQATDISRGQLNAAPQHVAITYSVQPAEETNFPDAHFDLITVAQAVHWFDFDRFYAEVNRTLRSDGVLVILGYGLPSITLQVDAVIANFYHHVIGPYWDPERHYIDEHYRTIPFPFKEIETPQFAQELEWELEQLLGYLRTWSVVKHYIQKHGVDPVSDLASELHEAWGNAQRQTVVFPLLLRIGVK